MSLAGLDLWLVILAAGLGTFLIRLSFFLLFERVDTVPTRVRWALSFVPPAVLAALVAPDIVALSPESFSPARLLAGLFAVAVAWRTESVLATIVSGLVALVVFQTVL
ncbi:AzlD domain-containing protein [Halomarina ordinaria]|uniref:AzlD domain-containing protein n=1 Tax=Halomarina ordinaria TaxID=3033939 RepID=A0ABD5UCW2_9EURY|nr:AzlD domain-containing protein [Halomarina sp. PSRA2]